MGPGAALRIECGDRRDLWLRYYPPREWNGGAKAAVRAGNYTSAMEIDGGDGALLSNIANQDIGITRALVDAMKTSETLVIEGAAAARVPMEQRTCKLPKAKVPQRQDYAQQQAMQGRSRRSKSFMNMPRRIHLVEEGPREGFQIERADRHRAQDRAH